MVDDSGVTLAQPPLTISQMHTYPHIGASFNELPENSYVIFQFLQCRKHTLRYIRSLFRIISFRKDIFAISPANATQSLG